MDSSDIRRHVRWKILDHPRSKSASRSELRLVVCSVIGKALDGGSPGCPLEKEKVVLIVRGIYEALLLLGLKPVDSSIEAMYALIEAADEAGQDREFLMRWGLVGISQAAEGSLPGTFENITGAFWEEALLGVGDVFRRIALDPARLPFRPQTSL